jgi:molybdopterin-containing oxidoreductase family iron-sulfur binding subunit
MSSLEPNLRYWRSFADLENSPEFLDTLADEFPEQAEQLADPLSRRRFFQLMGASLALAGISGCRWEEDHVVPLSRRPDNYIPGVPAYFATSMEVGGVASGLVAKSFDGRPIKVEGNGDHPFSGPKSTAMQQASLLHLYDPDRSIAPVRRDAKGAETPADWGDFDAALAELANSGARIHVLSEATYSPTVERLRKLIGARVQWFEWEPVSFDNELNGLALAYKGRYRTQYRFDQAKTIVALDCDFLGEHPASLRYAADWAAARAPEDGAMNRTYAVESAFSATGAAADHRLPLRSDLIRPFLEALEAKLNANARTPNAEFLKEPVVARFLDAIADDIRATPRRRALICVGPTQPAVVHAIAARINEAIGAVGMALAYRVLPGESEMMRNQIVQLVRKMKSGAVDNLIILGGNPVYNAPADLDFAGALKRVKQSIHLSLYDNETSALSRWHAPRTHYLEEWGDSRSWDGTYTLRQPLIRPLFGGRSMAGVLKVLAGRASTEDRAVVRETYIDLTGRGEKDWRAAVQLGFVRGQTWELKKDEVTVRGITQGPLARSQLGPYVQPTQLEVTFHASTSTHDGRFANNAWLQETPAFLTKLTWDNAALIAPKTAADLDIAHGDVISISIEGASVELPAYVLPGQAPSSIALELGYGRQKAGVVAGYQGKVDSVGVNTYPLRLSTAIDRALGAQVSKTGRRHVLATTQDHFQIDTLGAEQRAERTPMLVKTGTLEQYQRTPNFVTEGAHTREWAKLYQPDTVDEASFNQNLFKTRHGYDDGNKWGMTIDLTKCVGCNSCMLACQAENNVPVVGKEQVVKNREMHWIRIDRYFAGSPDDPQVAYQPVHCQQCENAPCEQVCPVGATLHSEDGLNDQAYNRCVGTRYCANNCPYKVRRFNFHYWHQEYDKARSKVRNLIFNPEVTVRSRGVMEKCTWCVQRIRTAQIYARAERRQLADGDIKTACQQACPTDAIVFGDLNDPTSRVTRLQSVARAYYLLPDLNNRPRNAFLARIRNPNQALEPR